MLYWTELEYIALHKVNILFKWFFSWLNIIVQILEQEEEEEVENPADMANMVEGLPELQNRASWYAE